MHSLTLVQSLVDKKPVRLANFGTFETYTAKAYTGRNPRTGDAVPVPSKERCRFRPHESFKKNLSPPKE
jgi:nucleoid DNA-binding protein